MAFRCGLDVKAHDVVAAIRRLRRNGGGSDRWNDKTYLSMGYRRPNLTWRVVGYLRAFRHWQGTAVVGVVGAVWTRGWHCPHIPRRGEEERDGLSSLPGRKHAGLESPSNLLVSGVVLATRRSFDEC